MQILVDGGEHDATRKAHAFQFDTAPVRPLNPVPAE